MNITTTIIFQTLVLTVFLLLVTSLHAIGQDSIKIKTLKFYSSDIDSILMAEDSAYYYSLINSNKENLESKMNSLKELPGEEKPKAPRITSRFSLNGGYISYATNYRSFIDTPYLEKNILQHNISGQLYGTAFGIPLQAIYYVRKGNSSFFRDIYDVQLSLDPAGLRRRLNNEFQKRTNKYASILEDSLTGKAIDLKQFRLNIIKEWLKSTFQKQRIIEAHEVLEVPHITYQSQLSDEQNRSREDSIKRRASRFLALYEKIDSLYTQSLAQLDSLKSKYNDGREKARQLRSISQAGLSNYSGYMDYQSELKRLDIPEQDLPKDYKNLLAIRTMSLGRSSLNYSELTAKNISINGINAEYNSWYYAAFSAGLVDFRFRDFAVNAIRQKQYLVLGRVGLGNLEKNYIIFSAFTGRKQLFAANPSRSGIAAINIKGYGMEAKWKVNKNSYLAGEIAESISPDFRTITQVDTKPGSHDYSNNAFALKAVTYYPATSTRLEGFYKYTGSNYQSFSSFQTNAALKTWYAKADQYFFKKILKISASLRSNDFSNPYIIQNYSSNTVFKSASLVFRKKFWPVISGGYMPMSQYTIVDQLITENRFQSVNANVYHLYKVGNTKTASTVMYNKFINAGSDSAFIYFNASNIYFAQNIFLGKLLASLAVSDTRNSQYQCQVFDESVQMNLGRVSSLTTGVKINNFNRQDVKVGGYISSSIKVWRADMIYLSVERGYLPGINQRLNRNDIATIQFIKTFGTFNN